MQSDRVTIVAIVDGIRVQFHARHTDPTIFEGRPALRMRLPELVLRLQRRDSFRVAASLSCQITLDAESTIRVLELRVADLSLGGVALVSVKNHVELECGQLLENCRIDLGTHGILTVSLVVKNLSENLTRNGLRQQRIGCSFAAVTREMETMISRYIGRAERERRTRD